MDRKNLILGIVSVIVVILLIAAAGLLGNEESSSSHEEITPMTPVGQETPLSHPTFQSLPLKITCGLRYHEYYNNLVHGEKATASLINIVVIQNNQATIFENTSSIELEITNLSTTEPLIIEIRVIPSNPNVSVIAQSMKLQANEIVDKEFYIPFDFFYPKENLAFPLTELEVEIAVKILMLECGGCDYQTKIAVASVIYNRMELWDKTLKEVIYQKNAFSTAKYVNKKNGKHYVEIPGMTNKLWKECYDAVYEVFGNGSQLPKKVIFFKTKNYHKGRTPYAKIGRLYFSYTS